MPIWFLLKTIGLFAKKGEPEKITDLTPDYFKTHNNSN